VFKITVVFIGEFIEELSDCWIFKKYFALCGAAVAQLVEALRFPMVPLEFFIGIILSVALSLFLGGKG
jgi:hypothetical protein